MSHIPLIAVSGGTGTIGSALLPLLAARPVRVRALVRDPARPGLVRVPGVEYRRADLADPASLAPAVADADRVLVLSSVSPDQLRLQDHLINAAPRTARVVKVSGLGASAQAPIGFARWHAEGEARLRAAGRPWTIVRPHVFLQNLLASAEAIRTHGRFVGAAGEGRASFVDTRDVAAVLAEVLAGDGHDGQAYDLTGPAAVSFAEIAAEIGRQRGTAVAYQDLPAAAFAELLGQWGLPGWLATDLAALHGVLAAGYGAGVTDTVQRLTGRPARSAAEFIRDHLAAFRPAVAA